MPEKIKITTVRREPCPGHFTVIASPDDPKAIDAWLDVWPGEKMPAVGSDLYMVGNHWRAYKC